MLDLRIGIDHACQNLSSDMLLYAQTW